MTPSFTSSLFSVAWLWLATMAAVGNAAEEDNAFEWAGAFDINDDSHTWIMQKVGGEYADPSMKVVVFGIPSSTSGSRYLAEGEDGHSEELEAKEAEANALFANTGDCPPVTDSGTFGPFGELGACFDLQVDPAKDTSTFTMDTSGLAEMLVFTAHLPTEFERDMHYLKDSQGENVEPTAQEGGGHHHHGDEGPKPSCACVAEEYGFKLDCSATAAMEDALSMLKASGCASDCDSDECQENWYIVQAHHDHCDAQGLPEVIEDDFHDFDDVCSSCAIDRAFIPGADKCPVPNCEDDSGNEAYLTLVDNACSSSALEGGCSGNTVCVEAYLTLRTVHDSCDHEVLTPAAEEGLHDFEEACEDVVCNAVTQEESDEQLVCAGDGAARGNYFLNLLVLTLGGMTAALF